MDSKLSNINDVFTSAVELKNKYYSDFEMDVDHLTFFTYDDDEYLKLRKDAEMMGKLENEDERGAMYKLNNVIEKDEMVLAFFKIAKPNVHSHYNHKYIVYLKVENFDDFSRHFSSISDEDVVKEKLPNKLEILNKNSNTILSVVPVTEPAIEDIEQMLSRTDEEKNLERLQSQLSEEQMKRVQVMADFQNYQRRVEQEKATWGAVSNMGLIREMLEVYDDLHLALNDENLSLDHAKVSMKSAQDKLIIAVTSTGVEVIDVKVGDEFDKEKMEAVSTIAAGDEQRNKVIAVISSAYKYKDREFILKPAKVVVGK